MKRIHRVDLNLKIFYTNLNVSTVMQDISIHFMHFILNDRQTTVVLLTKVVVNFAKMKYYNLKVNGLCSNLNG